MPDVNYQPEKVFLSRKIEFWKTAAYSLILKNQERNQIEFDKHGYIKEIAMTNFFKKIESTIKDTMKGQSKEFKELIEAIVEEHFQMTKKVDQNLHFLWHMYKKGTKAGDYKPFMLMAEMQLLKEMGYISAEEIQNMWAMIDSKDEDNFHLVWLAVRTWRLTRIKEHGVYSSTNLFPYMNIEKDYPSKILNHEVFLKTATTHNA